MKYFLLAGLMSATAVAARAGISATADETFGTNNYRGTRANVAVDVSKTLYVQPMFSTYRNDNSSGSFSDIGLRAGFEQGPFSLGVQGSFLPKNDGYRQFAFGADVTFSLSPGGTTHSQRMAGPSSDSNETFGYGLAGIDIGASANHIQHSDDYFASGPSGLGLRSAGAARPAAFTYAQNKFSVFAGAKFLITELSASISKDFYDRTLEGNGLREPAYMEVTNFAALESGAPESDYNLEIKWKTLPFVRPYLSFTHTNFKLGIPSSNATEVGLNVGLDMLSVKAAYGHYAQSGFADRNYATLGASLNF